MTTNTTVVRRQVANAIQLSASAARLFPSRAAPPQQRLLPWIMTKDPSHDDDDHISAGTSRSSNNNNNNSSNSSNSGHQPQDGTMRWWRSGRRHEDHGVASRACITRPMRHHHHHHHYYHYYHYYHCYHHHDNNRHPLNFLLRGPLARCLSPPLSCVLHTNTPLRTITRTTWNRYLTRSSSSLSDCSVAAMATAARLSSSASSSALSPALHGSDDNAVVCHSSSSLPSSLSQAQVNRIPPPSSPFGERVIPVPSLAVLDVMAAGLLRDGSRPAPQREHQPLGSGEAAGRTNAPDHHPNDKSEEEDMEEEEGTVRPLREDLDTNGALTRRRSARRHPHPDNGAETTADNEQEEEEQEQALLHQLCIACDEAKTQLALAKAASQHYQKAYARGLRAMAAQARDILASAAKERKGEAWESSGEVPSRSAATTTPTKTSSSSSSSSSPTCTSGFDHHHHHHHPQQDHDDDDAVDDPVRRREEELQGLFSSWYTGGNDDSGEQQRQQQRNEEPASPQHLRSNNKTLDQTKTMPFAGRSRGVMLPL